MLIGVRVFACSHYGTPAGHFQCSIEVHTKRMFYCYVYLYVLYTLPSRERVARFSIGTRQWESPNRRKYPSIYIHCAMHSIVVAEVMCMVHALHTHTHTPEYRPQLILFAEPIYARRPRHIELLPCTANQPTLCIFFVFRRTRAIHGWMRAR